MKKREVTYRFHDPNPEGMVADYLLGILIEANEKKVRAAIREAAAMQEPEQEYEYKHEEETDEESEEETFTGGMDLSF